MINMNLKQLRIIHRFTQEEIAEQLNVSRQAVAKWEKGETIPDISSCVTLAKLYNVTLDNLVNYSGEDSGLMVPPKGKHFFGSVTVGERGQIVIPKKARELFKIASGDSLIVVGDEDRGLAIVPQSYMQMFFEQAAFRPDETDR
ncbi:helix-turn-helix domain-containing protein [Bacillus massiliigorillae]|uniref:helix-turn-helix domain-containing protein n=1 Tax=Bacillus massiliigorillae TaxID=1243664 RepID=UPI00039BA519|nr:helix-turn-helix domain-containing protein [Bacillus massiliigorillae]